MRAIVCRRWGKPEDLTLEDVTLPALQPDQLRVAVKAAGVSFASSLVIAGKYQRKPPFPFTPGTEIAGIVLEVGSGVTRFKPGDRVMAAIDWGAMAEEALAREVNTFDLPANMDFATGVALVISYPTSAAALIWPHLLNVQPGQVLLVHGAAGGIGVAACEIGRALGATVIATAGGPEKVAFAKVHGAHHGIDYRRDDFRQAVLDLTKGRGVDAVFDPVGGDVFDTSLRCIAPEGRIAPVGFASGRIPQIPANILLVKNITAVGFNYGYYIGWSPDDARHREFPRIKALMDRLKTWAESGAIRPVATQSFALKDWLKAYDAVLGRSAQGRVVLAP
ncbi:MAG: NADPH:quinone oxidoreductase family protein [Reyranellaceae bacterium]